CGNVVELAELVLHGRQLFDGLVVSALDDGLKKLKQIPQLLAGLADIVEIFFMGGLVTRCIPDALLQCALRTTNAILGELPNGKIVAIGLQRRLRMKQDVVQERLNNVE